MSFPEFGKLNVGDVMSTLFQLMRDEASPVSSSRASATTSGTMNPTAEMSTALMNSSKHTVGPVNVQQTSATGGTVWTPC